ncbi:hypothetical protein N431DRAFT_91712 [Stipitochalara longipes BDJ]|nr:hypothetical protein N431DRAFT_91712 [Stipitochalara longipes BDJ]
MELQKLAVAGSSFHLLAEFDFPKLIPSQIFGSRGTYLLESPDSKITTFNLHYEHSFAVVRAHSWPMQPSQAVASISNRLVCCSALDTNQRRHILGAPPAAFLVCRKSGPMLTMYLLYERKGFRNLLRIFCAVEVPHASAQPYSRMVTEDQESRFLGYLPSAFENVSQLEACGRSGSGSGIGIVLLLSGSAKVLGPWTSWLPFPVVVAAGALASCAGLGFDLIRLILSDPLIT